jgi:hypothetical protein
MTAKYCALWLLLTVSAMTVGPSTRASGETTGSLLWSADTGG